MNFKEYWHEIYEESEEFNSLIYPYWNEYSHSGTWQFWLIIILLLAPLILLYFTIDRKRTFEILFYGYTVHMLWAYICIPLERHGLFVHKYFISPLFPFVTNIVASTLPVAFMLLYQYCTNNNKNYYLYAVFLSVVFAFGFATVEEWMGLVEFRKGTNQLHVFFIDIVIVFIAYWFTKFIIKLKS
ncbi:hypothetical protein CR203_12395 [Salipaludibacillus neizhouensis]|uniref:Uncharacterized protein n=1 Tax=Salipaludibacillus neizhouensis TaxID=885475 RepID=A0A3A9KHX5_9BACI|nr:hypothetical protein [Salipaludibacillus neizhouensis]RKL67295.1 hypothetical protein CR203_12395 [Salipaludibacillus neizhouensis]